MKKISLFFSLCLLFSVLHVHAAPSLPAVFKVPVPTILHKSSKPVVLSPLFPVRAVNPKDGAVTTIWARLQYENEYNSGPGLYGDVVVRFYEDNGATPTSVTGLTVNYTVIGYDGYNNYTYGGSTVAYGEYHVVASNQEHDYDDGETFRYKDYHIAAGDYETL